MTATTILHLTDRVSSRGGADWYLHALVAALDSAGVEQRLAVGRAEERAACPVSLVPGLDDPFALRDDRLVAELDALVERSPVIHVHNAIAPAVLDWAAARGAIATVQDHRSFCPGQGKLTLAGDVCRQAMAAETCASCFTDRSYHARIQAITEARLAALKRMRAIAVLSKYMQRELMQLGLAEERIVVVPPFVQGLDRDAAPDGPPCVLFAGRLVAAKGVHDAIAAWRLSEVDLPLVIAGTGPLRDTLPADVEALGWVPHSRMSGLYRRARALLMCSRWQEPFGIVGLEAQWMGVPVAAWQSGGIAEWHPGPLAPWGDITGLASALRTALAGPPPAPEPFERAALVDRMLTLYRRLVVFHPSRPERPASGR